ncbi:MAG: hypothetical protein KKD63_02800 [Proteobacteria bacterium]|nr:hypothetical protein [Desulfobulbaceae bacterium]MBU4151789.1 hypothetical protein [Pseudomonadota bacterium]
MQNSLISRFVTLVCATLLAMVIPRPALGLVLVVQSSAAEVYQQAVSGFTQAFTPGVSLPGISSIEKVEIVVLDPASSDTIQLTTQKHQSLQPKIIVAVGSLALKSVASFSGPVLFLMVPDPDAIVPKHSDLSGVLMTAGPAQQLAAIKEIFPGSARIGLLHNPATSEDFLKLLQQAAASAGLTLVSIPAASDREAIRSVTELQGLMDVLLLTPETSLVSPALLEALTLLSLEKKIPLVAFAPKYLMQGAALVVFSLPEAMGRQAGVMVRERLSRPFSKTISREYATEIILLTNPRIIQKMGISVVPSTINKGKLLP